MLALLLLFEFEKNLYICILFFSFCYQILIPVQYEERDVRSVPGFNGIIFRCEEAEEKEEEEE